MHFICLSILAKNAAVNSFSANIHSLLIGLRGRCISMLAAGMTNIDGSGAVTMPHCSSVGACRFLVAHIVFCMKINRGGLDGSMTQIFLDEANVISRVCLVRSRGMA